ncbi:hypothetical protein RhiirA1_488380 [Rhizophagus irregularis]|uniref:PNPLA domain-containing protein n=1 Tax=Rhizophagus irregularis TaxID=588596 RepID=A0A2N0RCT0_9GLOM|nr:hypothetical protein RhiirA1_488380 [Rhizophagus irregularis]
MPKTFEDYKDIVRNETFLHKMVNNPINESLIDLDESQTSDTNKRSEDQTSRIKENKKLISSLNILKSLAVKAAYSKRLTFIYHALNSPNKKEILFSNTQFTEEEINKRFRELALYFHSDKTNRPNTPIWLQETHKNLGTELFFVIIEFKENLLNDLKEILQNEGYLTFHEKNANKLWKIAIDYRNAVREQWSKLRLLRKEDIEEIPSEKLKSLSKDNGVLAYQEYRAACKIADSTKNLKKQVELRGNMALCLYISNKFIEAQLYSLAAIQLQLKNSQKVTRQDFIGAKKIFDKVKGGDPMADTRENDDSVDVEETPELDTEINIEDRSEHTMALVKTVDQEFSFFDKKTIQNSINNDMAKVSIKLMLKADRSLVRYQIPQEEILHAKNRALKYKASGVAAMGGAMTVGTSVTVAACFNIYEAVAIIGVTSIGGPFALIGGLLALGLGIWAGVNLWKRGNKLLEEPKIREKLNEIMVNALEAYDKGEYQKFIDAFSEEFKKDECLLKLEKREDTFDTKYIIDTLLNYGFRSDGIAYLLNLLGEVLCSGKIKIKGKVPKDLKELAMKAFDGVLNEKLENEARRLDDRIHELREKNHIASMLSKFRDFVSLEEYKNAGKEEIERAIKTIKEVRDSINCNYQFISAAKWRCEVLEDLLWVIGGEESPKESPEESSKLSLITYLEHECISHLSKKLQYYSSNQEKLHIYNTMAILYEQLAEKEDKSNRLNSLYHWKDAQRNYEMAHEADPENLDANLGIAKCLLKFSKYTKVIQLINTSPSLTTSSEYWYFRSIAYCKKVDYKNAKENIIEALRLDNKNKLAGLHKSLLKKLSKENTIEWRMNLYKKEKKNVKYEMNNSKSSHNKESRAYNILSIDGGGICGVLPALWLSEIEYCTHKPISYLFDMIAGTSAGGFIAAGLSVPSWKSYNTRNHLFYDDLVLNPKFSALDLLNIYQSEIKNFFTTDSSWSFSKSKYTDEGRRSLFYRHFGRMYLNQALTELVIPAVNNESNLAQTHLFTRHDAIKNIKNYTFVDALMATTAAPTFFPSYKIEGRGIFLDGALHLNNPAMAAYEKANQYNVEKEKISVLSLGTGSYISDSLVLPQQEGNTDRLMYSLLENRYQRWQIWFEEPIRLDDYESIPNLLELGHQYIEELDVSDENPINKLVESFEILST